MVRSKWFNDNTDGKSAMKGRKVSCLDDRCVNKKHSMWYKLNTLIP